MVGELALRHPPEEIAESMYRLMRSILLLVQDGAVPEWGHASLANQMQWVRLAKLGPPVLEKMEGSPLKAAAARLYAVVDGGEEADAVGRFGELPPPLQTAWVALAKHLHVCVDCDEAPSLSDVEQMMLEWFKSRLLVA